jgi:hypothetical protein
MIHGPRPARARLVVQPGDPAALIPRPPVDHRRPRHPDPTSDLGIAHPTRGQQHDPRPLRQPRTQ